jgi:Flp pilus assembly protein TadG
MLNNERGQSAFETVLILPLFVVVMLLGVNFGKALLIKQRAYVAARYAAWSAARGNHPTSEHELQQHGYGGDSLQLSVHSNTSSEQMFPGVSVNIRTETHNGSGAAVGVPRGETTAHVTYHWSPVGSLFSDASPTATHTLDVTDGRYDGSGGLTPTTRQLLSGMRWVARVLGF